VLPVRLLPPAAALGADYRGGRAGSKSSLPGTYNVIQDFPNVVIDYNAVYAYIAAMKLTENRIPVIGIGRGRAEAFPALGRKVITEGRPEKVLERTTDADPNVASVTLNERSSACVSLRPEPRASLVQPS
jgi:hypothetical protein